ncbi:hypothetical protein A7D23_13205 [Dehalobacter sp. TeCB1]|nr:hypothetical protein A7D23_13205 [Dehalobacter sp. TeCB1]
MKNYKMPKKYSRARKYNGRCEGCGTPTPANQVYSRIDESNIAISFHEPYLCVDCYNKTYKQEGEKNHVRLYQK